MLTFICLRKCFPHGWDFASYRKLGLCCKIFGLKSVLLPDIGGREPSAEQIQSGYLPDKLRGNRLDPERGPFVETKSFKPQCFFFV